MEVGTRRIAHCNVTTHPTADWTLQRFRETITGEKPYRFLIHDRDNIYSSELDSTLKSMGLSILKTPFHAPQANPYVERLIGSIRRECLDHVLVFHEAGLRRILKSYFAYYEQSRTHLSLGKDAPISRPIQPPPMGRVVEIPQVGGLHHYQRVAA
jgi:putative transposase